MPDEKKLLPTGAMAPEFSLPATPDQRVSLAEFRGGNVVLVFYPADWSPVCGGQLELYNELYSEFRHRNACLLGISVDNVWSHLAFAKERRFLFPLLSDFEPKGAVARRYGAYREHDGTCERALFVVDGEGVIRWSYLSPVGMSPGADGILDALDGLTGEKKAAS